MIENDDVFAFIFNHKKLTSPFFEVMSGYLTINQTLKSLSLCFNDIDDVGVKYLCNALCVSTSLTFLDLGYNKISDEGAKYMGFVLSMNSTLTHLDIRANKIGNEGAKHLSDALMINTTLTRLDIGVNKIGNEGAKFLSDALIINTTLSIFEMDHNRMSFGIHCPTRMENFIYYSKTRSPMEYQNKYWVQFMDTCYGSAPSLMHCLGISESCDSVWYSGVSHNLIERHIIKLDKSKLKKIIIDGIHLEDGIIPEWVTSFPNLRSLRFT